MNSPTPWTWDTSDCESPIHDANGSPIFTMGDIGGFYDSTAPALIVKAVNAHDDLVDALEAARQCLDRVPKLAESIDRLLAKVRA